MRVGVLILFFIANSMALNLQDLLNYHQLTHNNTEAIVGSEPSLYQIAMALPVPVRNRALSILAPIHRHDIPYLSVDSTGEVYYIEPPMYSNVTIIPPSNPQFEYITATALPILHSRPGAPSIIYLDFDGETFSNRAWNNGATIVAAPFDIDGNPSSWSSQEIAIIQDVYARVSEDYSPWLVDITTERPNTFTSTTAHAIVTIGNAQTPSGTAGGIAYLDVFGRSNYQFYSPAFIYYNNLGGGNSKNIAEALSHEVGHNSQFIFDVNFFNIKDSYL